MENRKDFMEKRITFLEQQITELRQELESIPVPLIERVWKAVPSFRPDDFIDIVDNTNGDLFARVLSNEMAKLILGLQELVEAVQGSFTKHNVSLEGKRDAIIIALEKMNITKR